jgi:hypothetical protein
MATRRRALIACVAACVAATAAAVWWATRPSPYRQAFDLVEIGMTAEAADAVLPVFTASEDRREKPVLLLFPSFASGSVERVTVWSRRIPSRASFCGISGHTQVRRY